MKFNSLWLMIAALLAVSSPCIEANPQKYALVFDMDEVFADLDVITVMSQSLWFLMKNPRTLYALLFTPEFRSKFAAIGKQSFSIASLGAFAREYPFIQPDFDSLMRIFHGQRRPNKPVIDLFIALKEQGYILLVATNRDRMAFELTAQALGLDKMYEGGMLFDHVITGHQSDYTKETTNEQGKIFSQLRFTLPDDSITQVNGHKPQPIYFQVMRQATDRLFQKRGLESPEIIFFDDLEKNVLAARSANQRIMAFQVPESNRATAMRKDLESIGIVAAPPALPISGVQYAG